MWFISLFLLLSSVNTIHASEKNTNKQEMQEMKRLHSQCMDSHKSSSNCHKDVIKACDATQEECLKMLERMDMDEVQKAQKNSQ